MLNETSIENYEDDTTSHVSEDTPTDFINSLKTCSVSYLNGSVIIRWKQSLISVTF